MKEREAKRLSNLELKVLRKVIGFSDSEVEGYLDMLEACDAY